MEPSKETITLRKDRLNSQIIGKIVEDNKLSLINRESLFDALQALFDECGNEAIQKYDKQILQFYEKYKQAVLELKRLRVNITDFEIKDVIGRGHFGEVHVVKEKHNGDIYAMKTLRKCDSLEKTAFDTERDIMAFTQSPWITSLQYAFQDSTCLYFVMEYHPGGDLLGLLFKQGGTLPESAAIFYLAEIVLALEDLHKMGYVHRDIKPDNVLLDRCGHIKLVDFGSAAKLNKQGCIDKAMPVGTPDYVAPEVLRSAESKNNKKPVYGESCDFWSLGIVAYELAIGKPPFSGSNTVSTYSRIMSYNSNLKFPPEVLLTQAYISLIRGLLVEEKSRLKIEQIKQHALFKNLHFDTIRDQVPPFVPTITSLDDTNNFTDMIIKKSGPSIENFKKKTQFSGRNLPFIGFTYTHDFNNFAYENSFNRTNDAKDEIIRNLKEELEKMKREAMKNENFEEVKLGLEKKLLERAHKLENIESVRDKLERELAGSIAELTALKRTLDFERKDRLDLERKALDLIKSAKVKWENSERNKIDTLNLKIEQQQEEIAKLSATNNLLSEQLDRAFKAEHKHKQSLAAVEQFGRRSVIGLQSHLEEVSLESQVKINSLQKKYDDVFNEKKHIEGELKKSNNRENSLIDELQRTKEKTAEMYNSARLTENLVKQLNDKVNELEKEIDNTEQLKSNLKKLTDQIVFCENSIRELQNANILLKNENKSIEEYVVQINNLKQIKTQHEKTINELESKYQEELQKNAALKQQNQESEALNDESQELKQLKMKMWRMEKEFSNTKIDKRILERELKDAQNEIKELNTEIGQGKQKSEELKKIHEAAMLELSNINEGLSLDLFKTREICKNSQATVETERTKFNEQKDFISQLKNTIHDKDIKISELLSKETTAKDEKLLLENELRSLHMEKLELEKQINQLKQDDQMIRRELDDCKRRFENMQLNFEALREACVLIENQVIEYERINSSIQAEKSIISENTEKLIKDLCKAKEDTQEAKKTANEEKSLRLLAESKIKRLNEDITSLQEENVACKEESSKYRDYANSLKEELTVSEKHVTDLDVKILSYERYIEEISMESNSLKEEISQYLTQIGGFKESNFRYKQQIEDHKETNNMLIMKLNELEMELKIKLNHYEERELKNDSTIKQQTKLIDYLQVKLDEHSTKKRTLTDKLFGSSKKENQNPITLSVNYKDLETQLLKQKQVNKSLQDEIFKLKTELMCKAATPKVTRHKSEIVSPQTKYAMEQLAKNPTVSKSNIFPSPKERMYHNIPHRFAAKLCKTITKCDNCSDQISLGREMSVCNECNACVHVSCAESMKGTCRLPTGFARHFRDSLSKLHSPTDSDKKNSLATTSVEGWIKVLSKNNTWERRYAFLDDKVFNIYTNSSKADNVIEHSVDLNVSNMKRKVILEPLESEIGVSVATSDLPFVIKVEMSSDCWPMGFLVFMALTMEDRDKWFNALEKNFANVSEKYNIESILNLPEDIYPNCIMDVTKNIIVIGTDQGLYAYFNDGLIRLEDLTDIQQIGIILETNVVVMVAGTNGSLISCDLNHLINLIQCAAPSSKPLLTYKNITIKDLDGYHFLQTSNSRKHQMFCAATPKQLVIVQFDLDSNDFIPLRIMDTAEPLGCVLFTEHTLIVGVDKFFEIDLSSFKAEEFLDTSDIKLKPLVKCHKLQSFPLAILPTCDNPKEYLLCFNELAVFVDEYGRSSRNVEVKSSHLPIGFQYIQPYLFIIQFTGVEILKLSEDTLKEEFPTIKVDLKKMRYLGKKKNGLYVFHNQKIKFLEGNKLMNLNDNSSILSSTETEESDRFSFTSSMVQSLDGNLSDVCNSSAEEINITKKVTFSSETDL